jgi:DNA-binding NtrC family response regulator
MIESALQRTGDNRTEAAEILGLSRRTLQRKLQEMGKVKRVRRKTPSAEAQP